MEGHADKRRCTIRFDSRLWPSSVLTKSLVFLTDPARPSVVSNHGKNKMDEVFCANPFRRLIHASDLSDHHRRND